MGVEAAFHEQVNRVDCVGPNTTWGGKMKLRIAMILLVGLAVVGAMGRRMGLEVRAAGDSKREIEAFNQKMDEVTLKMDNAGVMAMWAEDGVTLLPGMAAVEGKKSIAKFLDDVVSQLKGYHVTEQKSEFHSIEVSGDWAFEWGTTYQVVQPPDGKPPIANHGKILLVLHREANGEWKLKREMWNSGVNP
jgi:uncharacterized protein (TIGR02246 family)